MMIKKMTNSFRERAAVTVLHTLVAYARTQADTDNAKGEAVPDSTD